MRLPRTSFSQMSISICNCDRHGGYGNRSVVGLIDSVVHFECNLLSKLAALDQVPGVCKNGGVLWWFTNLRLVAVPFTTH